MVKRKYRDVNGRVRQLTLVNPLSGFVNYLKDQEERSIAQVWKDEDGCLLQIPLDAWDRFNIAYEDIIIED